MENGRLLIAVPGMLDPHFDATVVFLFEEAEGAAGVVLNRPTDIPLSTALPQWEAFAADPAVVFWGGPVQEDRAVALAATVSLVDEKAADDIEVIDLEEDADAHPKTHPMRVFAGYAGWEEGQLDAEIAEGGWFVVPAQAADVLTTHPEGLWRSVFGRQDGPLRRYRTYPDDPGLN